MAKITYLLGAGASYYACPILEKQAEMMIKLAYNEINRLGFDFDKNKESRIEFNFINQEYINNFPNNEYKILWHIGYFGVKAREYGTIDTYARKLYLNNELKEYKLLKMCVSVFFDLWENFYYKKLKDTKYSKIDNRYKSLFSVLLDNENNKIKLNNDFKFITWNYDLQLEETFKLFLGNNNVKDFDFIDTNFLKFRKDINSTNNDIFHLNGHRGFFKDVIGNSEKEFVLNNSEDIDDYWKYLNNLYSATISGIAKFDNYINYAWEHISLNDSFFQKIANVLAETEVLVIIGYSFPAFNRKIDQFLFSNLNKEKIKKIIYQDPNASKDFIENILERPSFFSKKIIEITQEKDLKQFHLPNNFFITQKSIRTIYSYNGVTYEENDI